MKKIISIVLLVALCCTALFAADVTLYGRVKFTIGFGDKGFVFTPDSKVGLKGTEDLGNGYKIGFNLCLNSIDLETLCLTTNLSLIGTTTGYKLNYDLGSDMYLKLKNDINLSFTHFSVIKVVDVSEKNRYSYSFGLAYRPDLFKTDSGSDLFVVGQANYSVENVGTFHFDALGKVNFNNGNTSLKTFLGELTYGDSKYFKRSTEDCFKDETWFFDFRSSDEYYDNTSSENNSKFYRAGLRYRYDVYKIKEDNGFFLYGVIYDYPVKLAKNGAPWLEAESEIGLHGADFTVGGKYSNSDSKASAKTNVKFGVHNVDGEIKFSVSEAFLLAKIGDAFIWTFNGEYLNKATNTPESNGAFLNVNGYYPLSKRTKIELDASVGLDAAKAFRWEFAFTPTHAF